MVVAVVVVVCWDGVDMGGGVGWGGGWLGGGDGDTGEKRHEAGGENPMFSENGNCASED